MYPSRTTLGRLIEMSQPVKTNLVYSPAIIACEDSPFGLESAVLVPGEEVVFSLNDEAWHHDPTIRAHSLDHCNPLPIVRLLRTRSTTAFGACYDLYTRKYAHLEPSLIEIVNVPLLDGVLVNHVPYRPKPRAYHVGIFALDPVVIDSASEMRRKLWVPFHEAVRPSGPDA